VRAIRILAVCVVLGWITRDALAGFEVALGAVCAAIVTARALHARVTLLIADAGAVVAGDAFHTLVRLKAQTAVGCGIRRIHTRIRNCRIRAG
jgi:hypothetical protein